MEVTAFIVIAVMIGAYVLFDGYDLGIGSIVPLVAADDRDRLTAMRSIGPFWNGNETFLIAGAGALFALFPRAYASSFSGFYLPFIIVLWLLMGRGVSLELRDHFSNDLWHQFWDAIFTIASVLLAFLFGVALGNLLRGVPLDAQGFFQGTFGFLLNWYALLVGIFAVVALAFHGATFLILRTDGPLTERTRKFAQQTWIAVLVLFILATVSTFFVHAGVPPWALVLGLFALGALVYARVALTQRSDLTTFLSSSGFLALLMAAAASTIFPYLLPAFPGAAGQGLSIFNASPAPTALFSALGVTIVGMIGVFIYGSIVVRLIAGKVSAGE
jgi:cytochrome bd ubiquinol oxidase subunit II